MLSFLNVRANIGPFHFSFSIRSLVPLIFTPPSPLIPPTFSCQECFYYLFPKFFLVLLVLETHNGSRIFNEIFNEFIVVVKSYMGETSDNKPQF